MSNIHWNLNEVIFLTDIFLYGWPLTLDTFTNLIFPKFKQHLVSVIPKYYLQLSNPVHFSAKQQKMFKSITLGWLEEERLLLVGRYEKLKDTSVKLQLSMVEEH
jgi:hypothetical protein